MAVASRWSGVRVWATQEGEAEQQEQEHVLLYVLQRRGHLPSTVVAGAHTGAGRTTVLVVWCAWPHRA